jgi:mRNA interferase MazF
MSFKRGDVLIALVPHADVSGSKPRPVVVVQADAYNAKIANLVVAAVTSNLTFAADAASLLIDVSTAEGRATGLRHNSVVSCINLATIDQAVVARKIGSLGVTLMQYLNRCLKTALDLP